MAANKFATLLNRKTNKITLILIYALLEWILIFFLLLNSLFFYLILKFADYFGLTRPCLLCSRVDHLFDPANDKSSYRDLICDAHAAEISKLGFCSTHRKLAESHDMCEDCSSSSKPELSQKFAYFPWMKQIGMIRDDEMEVERIEADSVKCSCCEVKMEKEIYSPYLLLKPSWGGLDYTEGENLIKEDTRLVEAVVDEDKGNHSDPDSAPENPKDEEMVEETRGIHISRDVEDGIEGKKEVEEFSGFLSSFDCQETKDPKADLIKVEEEEGVKKDDTNESQNSNKGKFLEIPRDHIEFYFDQDDCHLIPIELMDSTTLNTDNGDVILDFDVHMRREKLDVVVESRHSFEETVELLTANESKKERMAAILLESSGFDLNVKESSSLRRDDDLIENGFRRDGVAQAKRDVEIIAAAIGEKGMETEDQQGNVEIATAAIEKEHTETEDQQEIVEATAAAAIDKEEEETENCQGDVETIAEAVGKEDAQTYDHQGEEEEAVAAAVGKEDTETEDQLENVETIAAAVAKEDKKTGDQQGNVETIVEAIDEDHTQAENHEGYVESIAAAIGKDETHREDHEGDVRTFAAAINNGDMETEDRQGDDVKTIGNEDHQGDATTINNVDIEKKDSLGDDVETIAAAIGIEDMKTEDLQGDLKKIAAEIGEEDMGLDDHEVQAYDDVVHDEVESDETDADISIGTEIPDHEPIEIDDHQNEECPYTTTHSSELLEHDDHGSEQGEELLEFKVTPIETNEKVIQLASDLQEIEEDKVPDTPTSIDSFHQLHKRLLLLERKESGTEDSLDSSSVVSDIDGSDAVVTTEKLKSALKTERKALNALYSELEEERSASSIAASQTMAMINRLQEEKATMQMEALQYQRMMEEQSEYDQEALQLMNDLMVKREKEKAELEKELDICRKKLQDYEAKEHMLRLRIRKDRSVSRTSSASCSIDAEEDIDGLNVDLNQGSKEEDSFCNLQETNQNTPVDTVLCLEDSFSTFEDERLSILDQLKALESKLLTLSDDEDQCFEDIKPLPNFNEENGNKHIEDINFSPEENDQSKATNEEHHQERRIMTQKAKRLLPLFDATEEETEEEVLNGNGNGNGNVNGNGNGNHYEHGLDSVSSPNSSMAKFEMENKRAAIEEEVDHVYERLQALEADREFLKHCLNSLRKGDKGIYLLQEILQHLRDLKGVEHRVKNMGTTTTL